MENLECPFTWDMSCLVEHWEMSEEVENRANSAGRKFSKLMRNVMCIFVEVSKGSEEDIIMNRFKICDDIFVEFEKENDQEISAKVAKYILEATKCFAYHNLDMHFEKNKILDKIQSTKFIDKKEKSTLFAAKGILWIKNIFYDKHDGEKYLRKAIDENPECHYWYYALAKFFRRKRRDLDFGMKPSEEEMDLLMKAYELSKKTDYQINIAQMYRDNWENEKALEMYEEILNNFSDAEKTSSVLLRLALGFMKIGKEDKFEKAKKCLDEAEMKDPERTMYLHYRGIYLMKIQEYEEAVVFFKRATDNYDISSENDYLQCQLKIDENFEILKFLLNLFEKYKIYSKKQLQPFMLDLAMYYWKKENNFVEALNYFYEAIKIDPKAVCLKSYFFKRIGMFDCYYAEKNLIKILKYQFLPRIKNRHDNNIQNLCDEDFTRYSFLLSYCNN